MNKTVAWGLMLFWAGSLLAGILFFGQRQLHPFDPNGVLLHQSTSADFDAALVSTLLNNHIQPNTVLHIGSAQHCYCDSVTAPHQLQLAQVLENEGYNVKTVTLDSAPSLAKVIHATPALIIVDNQSKLRYLGPYAVGYGCFTGNTLVEQIATLATQTTYNGAVINADAQGCFCTA